MKSAIEQFRTNISRVRDLVAIYSILENQTAGRLVFSDILRAAFLLNVSALDYYIHEVVRMGMLEIYCLQRPPTKAFSSFKISLSSTHNILNGLNIDSSWLDNEIRVQHSYKSFQQSEKISDAIKLISDKKLWEEVSKEMEINAKSIKQNVKIIKDRIDSIVERRNKIAHEADIDPSFPGKRKDISEVFVIEAVDFIEQVVEIIHKVL
ncbi:HEPN domain-containing protein [Trichormus variabilis]|uniref:RiboL-PSP-HEPN domain-containing protein n=1 Tax=Trichormus variabilis SAG 1403-4b TaxID=447716 RepID=A0A3S1IL28_ANAVA|nr:HEPN domain-containing protein [Trichormus variabilis]MBD2625693.1 hypothetical protein [Trichormus variabilis FACHB-164]RUS98975.1 hypothetical protein DSM107003_09940 [Trichormus variabilis SAG 1403-4b]